MNSLSILSLIVQVPVIFFLALKGRSIGDRLSFTKGLFLGLVVMLMATLFKYLILSETELLDFVIRSLTIWLFAFGAGLLAAQYRKV